jgi:TolA-binding protein
MMKTIFMILIPLSILYSGQPLAETQAPPQTIITQTETHSVFKGFFLNVWSKLRAFNPQTRHVAKPNAVYTAGIRGAEATETLIQPYWKGDLSQDEKFQQELKKFSEAQLLMDNGELDSSQKAFASFIHQYSNSTLVPNALFAKALCYAGLGKKVEAKISMQQFVDENPNHPLVTDAKQVIAQLK